MTTYTNKPHTLINTPNHINHTGQTAKNAQTGAAGTLFLPGKPENGKRVVVDETYRDKGSFKETESGEVED